MVDGYVWRCGRDVRFPAVVNDRTFHDGYLAAHNKFVAAMGQVDAFHGAPP